MCLKEPKEPHGINPKGPGIGHASDAMDNTWERAQWEY